MSRWERCGRAAGAAAQTWCQDGVTMFKANDLPHLLQHFVLHEDENRSYLVREPTWKREKSVCQLECASFQCHSFTCSCWQQLLAIPRPERQCPVRMTVGWSSAGVLWVRRRKKRKDDVEKQNMTESLIVWLKRKIGCCLLWCFTLPLISLKIIAAQQQLTRIAKPIIVVIKQLAALLWKYWSSSLAKFVVYRSSFIVIYNEFARLSSIC